MEYDIINNISNEILNFKLLDLLCKHVFNLESIKSQKVLEESNKLGYRWARWGTHSGNLNIEYHMNKIIKMEADNYNHAIRVVMIKYPFSDKCYLWTDNLHSTIKYIRTHGLEVCLRDIPFYVVDLTNKTPLFRDSKNLLRNDKNSCLGAIESSLKRRDWSSSKKIIDVNYTVCDFLNENPELLVR